MRLAGYLSGRVAVIIVVLGLLSLIVFVGVDLLPGDPATARLGPGATPEQVEQVRERLGSDRPVLDRYREWVGGLVHGDLGTSASGKSVGEMVGSRLGNSVVLTAVAFVLLVPLSLLVGVLLGRRAGTPADRIGSSLLLLTVSIPEFVVAALLVLVLAVGLGWLPAVSLVPAGDSPLQHPDVLVLPVVSLVAVSVAWASRIIRASVATALRAPHVEFLRLNGVSEPQILRQAVLPAVYPAAAQIWLVAGTSMIGGAALVEVVFGYPGIGSLLVTSVQSGDLPVAQALAMTLGAATLLGLVAADVIGTTATRRRPA
jgi:peptide/nickel transport system permease protein